MVKGLEGEGEPRMEGARRWRQREKSGEGNWVRDLTRMAVTVSSRVRCGLNWYLCRGGSVSEDGFLDCVKAVRAGDGRGGGMAGGEFFR